MDVRARRTSVRRITRALGAGVLLAALAWAEPRAAVFEAAGYSFSDEAGGFKLLSVSGSGTAEDPIVIVEEVYRLEPIVLVVRRLPHSDDETTPFMGFGAMTLGITKVVINRTQKVWGGFDLELQETLNQPSIYGDGLSFDQPGIFSEAARSDRFRFNRLQQEPYDRILYRDGEVDPDMAVQFTFFVTDPTPPRIFYILQDPQFLSADLEPGPGPGAPVRSAAGQRPPERLPRAALASR